MKDRKIIDAGSGICPLGPSNKVKAAIRKAAKEIKETPDGSIKRLERFFLSKFGLPDDRILLANSVRELLCSVMRALGPRKVLIVGPAPRLYEEAASRTGAEVLYSDSQEGRGFAVDAGGFIRDLEGVDLVFVADPNLITGISVDETALSLIMEMALQKKMFVVIDESLMEFTSRGGYSRALGAGGNVITLRTTALFYGLPGLELAYAVSDRKTIRRLMKGKDCSMNILSVEAARAALKDDTYRSLVCRFIADEKELLSREMKKVGGMTFLDSDSNVYLVKLERHGEGLLDSFYRAGFLIRDCGDIAGLGKSFLRLSVMSHDRNLKLLRLMKTLVPSSVSAG
jgi:threonine-phosphate decarboxylase